MDWQGSVYKSHSIGPTVVRNLCGSSPVSHYYPLPSPRDSLSPLEGPGVQRRDISSLRGILRLDVDVFEHPNRPETVLPTYRPSPSPLGSSLGDPTFFLDSFRTPDPDGSFGCSYGRNSGQRPSLRPPTLHPSPSRRESFVPRLLGSGGGGGAGWGRDK